MLFRSPLEDGSNKVDIFVFTYFDLPEEINETTNAVIDGRICKVSDLITLPSGKEKAQFILANNIILNKGESSKKLNSYIPCIVFGKQAKEILEHGVNTFVKLEGNLRSRHFKKHVHNNNSEDTVEIRLAHEFVVSKIDF